MINCDISICLDGISDDDDDGGGGGGGERQPKWRM